MPTSTKPELSIVNEKPASPTLNQRINAVMAALEVRETGRNAFNASALSIEDIEEDLQPKLAASGIVTWWSMTDLHYDGTAKLWVADLTVVWENADDPADARSGRWLDVGATPAAATSYAVKNAYKKILHIAAGEPEVNASTPATATRRPSPSAAPPTTTPAASSRAAAPSPAPSASEGSPCPECGRGQLRLRKGSKGDFLGCSRYPDCKFTRNPEVRDQPVRPSLGATLRLRHAEITGSDVATAEPFPIEEPPLLEPDSY